eukprot:m.33708 g.33708  ORF g.33708 m.33708 type:complete len:74 (-) comp16858_c0_seq1:130-351(-)
MKFMRKAINISRVGYLPKESPTDRPFPNNVVAKFTHTRIKSLNWNSGWTRTTLSGTFRTSSCMSHAQTLSKRE